MKLIKDIIGYKILEHTVNGNYVTHRIERPDKTTVEITTTVKNQKAVTDFDVYCLGQISIRKASDAYEAEQK